MMASNSQDNEEFLRSRLYRVAKRIIDKEFESDDFKVQLPREGAALESLPYGRAEELLVKASGNYETISYALAAAKSAHAYFTRMVEITKKQMLGDKELRESTKNEAERESVVYNDAKFLKYIQVVRTAETVAGYLEPLLKSSDETLQVVKKVRDAAWGRDNRTSR